MLLSKIASHVGGKLFSDHDIEINSAGKIETASRDQISFLSNPKYRSFLPTTTAGAIIVEEQFPELKAPYILVENAYSAFMKVLQLFDSGDLPEWSGISEFAFISPMAKTGANVQIGPLAYLGPGVSVGDNTVIFPGAVILKNARIGSDCRIYPNVTIGSDCIVEDRVIIHGGTVLGSDGFGFAPVGTRYEKIPQTGIVHIEPDVEIGSNCSIDRATMGETLIRRGTKLDNLVQIAHNVVVGEDTVMAAQSGVAGSAILGNHLVIGGQVGIVGHLKLSDNLTIAGQSGVSKNFEAGETIFGSPALPIREQKKIQISIKHLPEIIKRINLLEKEVAMLREKLSAGSGN